MNEWWNRKVAKTRKRKKASGDYRFYDFLFDVLFWLPEIILLPFRILFWCLRMVGRLFAHLLDNI